jgi:lipocalin
MRKKFLAGVTGHGTHIQCKMCSGCTGAETARGSNSYHNLRILFFQYFYEGQYKVVSTAICYMLIWSKVRTPAKARDFVFSIPVQTNPGTHPASTTMSTGALSRE